MKNIIITTANTSFYNSLLTLIASVHNHSFDLVDQIFVFDLGLNENQIENIKTLSKVSIVTYPQHVNISPKEYAYKCYCNYWAQDHADRSFWLDAGTMLLQPIDEIFNIIEEEAKYSIYIQKADNVMPWKDFNKNMAISVEYDLSY